MAARLSTDFEKKSYAKLDKADDESCKPNFCVLVYPAYLQNGQTKRIAAELPVTADTPPTFIIQTKDDKRFIAGTIAYDKALKNAGVSSTFHLFPNGGHGYGLRPSKYKVSTWPSLCETWLKKNAIISGK